MDGNADAGKLRRKSQETFLRRSSLKASKTFHPLRTASGFKPRPLLLLLFLNRISKFYIPEKSLSTTSLGRCSTMRSKCSVCPPYALGLVHNTEIGISSLTLLQPRKYLLNCINASLPQPSLETQTLGRGVINIWTEKP